MFLPSNQGSRKLQSVVLDCDASKILICRWIAQQELHRRATPDINRLLNQQKPLWNIIAIAYTFTGYLGGIALLLMSSVWLNVVGVVWLTHSLILSAYLAHEFMHSTIFQTRAANAAWGNQYAACQTFLKCNAAL